jgi:peroxiredoxin
MKASLTKRPRALGRICNRILIALLTATALTSCSPKFEIKSAPAVTFLTVDGRKLAIGELRGKVVLVNFWATDCPICRKEMPRLIETHNKFKARGYETVAVAMWYDPPNRVVDYTKNNALPFAVSFDPVGDIARAFGDVTLTPTSFVVDRRGEIVARYAGEPDFAKLHQLLESKLAEAP